MITSRQSTAKSSVDELHQLINVIKKHLPTLKENKTSMISLHLSDIAGELPHFQKSYNALVQSEELSEDDFIDCIVELEVSVFHILGHIKDLHKLLKKAEDALP